MVEARMLLCNTLLPIREVASRVGYDDVHYFTRLFTKKQGLSPGQYREMYTDIPIPNEHSTVSVPFANAPEQ